MCTAGYDLGKSNCRNDCDGYGKTTVQVRAICVVKCGEKLYNR